MYKLLYITLFIFAAAGAQAQDMPERSLVRKGNRQYNKGNYEQALQAAAGQFEATYNLGNALYKAERFDRAEQRPGPPPSAGSPPAGWPSAGR